MINIKRLLLLTCFSVVGVICVGSEYPHLRRKFPQESHVSNICEDNASRPLSDNDIIESCQRFNNLFPALSSKFSEMEFTTKGQSLIFEKRQLLYDSILTQRDPLRSIQHNVTTILKNSRLSQSERKKEEDFVLEYILRIAEEPDQK